MVTIEIDNSYSQIKGLKTEEFRALRKLLSYEANPEARYYTRGFVRTKYLIDNKGFFPTGLEPRVSYHLWRTGLKFDILDKRATSIRNSRIANIKISLNGLNPYIDQLKAVDAAEKSRRGGIVMPTGTGKSLVIALIAARLNVKTLVVVPSLEIKKQLSESLSELLNGNSNIVVENIDSKALKTLTDFDCLIIDECHHVAATTYQKLNKTAWNNIYYRFFLTATFFRNNENEQLLFEGIAGQVIHQVTVRDAIAKDYIVPVEAYYYDLPKQRVDGYTWAEVYKELIINNTTRNSLIANLMLKLQEQDKSTLCLVKEISHGSALSFLTGIPFANGQDDTTRDYIRQFNSGGIKALIGTTGILSEGVDTKPCEYIIIAGLGKAKSAFLQQVGRAVRRYPGKESAKVIIFRDKSHKWTLSHFKAQSKVLLDEFGVNPIKLDYE